MNEAMQASEFQQGDEHAALIQEMMGLQQQMSPDNPMASQLLQLLAQQEEEQQRSSSLPQTRPDEHYLTIAQNGTCVFVPTRCHNKTHLTTLSRNHSRGDNHGDWLSS